MKAALILLGTPLIAIVLVVLLHTTPHKYEGRILSVSAWDGSAILLTKTKTGADTTIEVHAGRYETFEVGQILTVWTGGDLIGSFATTKPQH